MGRLQGGDAKRARAISTELDTIRLGSAPVMDVVLAQVTALAGFEVTAVYSLRPATSGWALERFHYDRGLDDVGMRFERHVRAAADSLLFYDLVRPPPNQRDRVIEATAWVDRAGPGTWVESRMSREVMAPSGMRSHKQLRALVCEGPSLLGWFGGLQAAPTTTFQADVIRALMPAMRRRLSIEQRLAASPRSTAMLEAALGCIGAPAFVLGPRGEVYEANSAARALLARQPRDTALALRDAVARKPTHGEPSNIELVEIRDRGARPYWLAIIRMTGDAHADACVAAAVARWRLTPRQRDVLALVVRGLPNATIAATLGIGDRAIEQHVTALLDRVQVDGRAALVARVLTVVS